MVLALRLFPFSATLYTKINSVYLQLDKKMTAADNQENAEYQSVRVSRGLVEVWKDELYL